MRSPRVGAGELPSERAGCVSLLNDGAKNREIHMVGVGDAPGFSPKGGMTWNPNQSPRGPGARAPQGG